ncbi:MAG: hypothetical protein HY721_06040 [Planctomycetes bacterium]|nr:hypothetical protein [Planctomycetota bacterium]
MRLFKQALLSMALLVVTLVTLSLVRLGRTPAQVNPAGEGQVVVRNGDVDCDGQINITDPIITLNWLFGDGPEPCAIAQSDTCCTELRQEVATLRAAVETLASRVPGPGDIVTLRGTIRFTVSGTTKTIVDVPEGRRFVVTSYAWLNTGGPSRPRLVSVIDGKSTEIPAGFGEGHTPLEKWTSGFAFPAGADVGLTMQLFDATPYDADFYLNGYFSGE